jgi:Arc/MetJ-type ribon-helix-helix transcriptional regulator
MTQIVARIPEEVVQQLDELVSAGTFDSRSDAVREALVQLIDRLRREEIGRQIVEGYKRMPQTDDEFPETEALAREMIEEEPW